MSKRPKPYYLKLGSISHETMRPEDLIPTFLDECKTIQLTRPERTLVCQIASDLKHEWYFGEKPDAVDDDLTALFDILDAHCRPFTYFGASEGDGSDYGCWVSIDALEEAVLTGEVFKTDGSCHCSKNGRNRDFAFSDHAPICPDLKMPVNARYRFVVNDHGNMSLYYANGRVVWEVV